MNRLSKMVISYMLAAVLAFGSLPVTVFADETEPPVTVEEPAETPEEEVTDEPTDTSIVEPD